MKHSNLTRQWEPIIKNVMINGTRSYEKMLTKKQSDVLINWLTGRVTQRNIAKKLGICQTSVHKTLFGNIDYSRNKKRYGGIFKKIKKFDSGSYTIGTKRFLRKNPESINWNIFRDSAHSRECIEYFAKGEYGIRELMESFQPNMPEQTKEARRLIRLGVKRARSLARRALERGIW